MISNNEQTDAECFYFSIVYQENYKGQTPFDIAIKKKSFRSVEIMLDMLSKREQYNFSKYI